MKRFSVLLLTLLLILPPMAFAKKVGDVNLPESLKAGDTAINLSGAGLRKKMWIKVYAGGLYLTRSMKKASDIINADESMAIRLHMIYSGITSEKMQEAFDEGFTGATNGNTATIKREMARFNACFKEAIAVNDVYDIIYQPGPGMGLSVFKNGVLKDTIPGVHFKRVVFSIWLGDKPADEGLKESMLAGYPMP